MLKVGSSIEFISSPANPDKHYKDSLRVEFRFWDGKDNVYVVLAEDGISLLLVEKDAELQEAASQSVPVDWPKMVTKEDHQTEVDKLNGEIRTLQCDKVALNNRIESIKKDCEKSATHAVGCLESVKAMLQHSVRGATHRQRNFYSEAMVAYIDNAKGAIKTSYSDEYPF